MNHVDSINSLKTNNIRQQKENMEATSYASLQSIMFCKYIELKVWGFEVHAQVLNNNHPS